MAGNSFKNLKKKRTNIADLAAKLESASGKKKDYGDDRIYKPHVEPSGNGYAIIRLLPPSENCDIPFVKVFDHGFQGPGGWYIDKCPTTIEQDCPVCTHNRGIVEVGGGWESLNEKDKKLVRDHKRRESYISNILVIKDEHQPELEGQVMLYKYGKSIFDKILTAMEPEFADEDALNPFDFWEGADFKIKIRKADGGWRSYDRSEFAPVSVLLDGDDDELEEIYNKQYDLNEFTDPANFKGYGYYETKLNNALNLNKRPVKVTEDTGDDNPAPTSAKADSSSTDDSEDMLDYFKNMAGS